MGENMNKLTNLETLALAATPGELPPLPDARVLHRVMPDDFRYGDIYGYTKQEMIDYGKKCAANPATILKLCEIIRAQQEALESIREYWNQDQNEDAMADALWHNINVADAALAKANEVWGGE